MNYTVVQCVNNLDLGGLERVVLILGRQLRARSIGCEIVCIEDRGTLADEAERNGLPVIALHAEKAGKRSALRSMISHLKQVDAPVVLHSHNFKPFWYAARARFYGVAIGHVHTRHGAFLRRHRFLWRYRLMRRWTDAIATVSADGRDQLARWSGLRPQDIHVVPNGVDTDTYRPADSKMAVRQRLGWTQPGAVIITVARLAPEKDLATLLRAVALMPQVAWWLVGYGSEEESLRELARQLGLIDRVVFWGQRADIPDLLQAADVFALSSLSEGLSMALIEAAACGLPIVATDVGGNREIVQPPHAGRLVPPQDPRALATALDEILSDEALRKTLSANARQTAVDRFSVAAMVERYRMLYEMALRRHSSS